MLIWNASAHLLPTKRKKKKQLINENNWTINNYILSHLFPFNHTFFKRRFFRRTVDDDGTTLLISSWQTSSSSSNRCSPIVRNKFSWLSSWLICPSPCQPDDDEACIINSFRAFFWLLQGSFVTVTKLWSYTVTRRCISSWEHLRTTFSPHIPFQHMARQKRRAFGVRHGVSSSLPPKMWHHHHKCVHEISKHGSELRNEGKSSVHNVWRHSIIRVQVEKIVNFKAWKRTKERRKELCSQCLTPFYYKSPSWKNRENWERKSADWKEIRWLVVRQTSQRPFLYPT